MAISGIKKEILITFILHEHADSHPHAQITFNQNKRVPISLAIAIYTPPNYNCEAYRSSFFPSTFKLWNNLPIEITSSSNLNDFINKLDSYLY